MADERRSRRTVLGASAAAITVGLGGCTGILENGSSDSGSDGDSDDSDEATDDSDEATDDSDGETAVLFSDDFESGSLDEYEIVEFPGDDDTESYHITTEPSRGEYAVQHRTESRYLTPADEVTLEPPLTFSLDFYVERWSGIDIALQHDEAQNLTYLVKVRNNNSGRFIEVVKKRDEFTAADATQLRNDRNENSTFSTGRWETVTIDWTSDGTITVRIPSSGESVSITDTELTGHPFRLAGYHYTGSTAFDNIEISR